MKDLEARGFRIYDLELDLIDQILLEDITEAFLAENFEGRQRMRDLIINRE
jgi:hypothetical protein